MKPFTTHQGIAVAIDRPNIDTDAIIPKQFLKSIKRSGFGVNLFDEWRYLDVGAPGMDNSTRPINPDFSLNQARYQGASILVARENFGCGSSREHAVWALDDYGFRAVIAPSYSDIFFNNCFKNGVLPIVLSAEDVDIIIELIHQHEGLEIIIDLPSQQLICQLDGKGLHSPFTFDVDAFRKYCLLNGFDDIGLTLQHTDDIKAYEERMKQKTPWVFMDHAL
ncbi:3-isopropylmalate dehydratase small subunit [Wohlfahrtiimonas chitiniclastica]|uniref:3-isopropylmalate dehydratase small subunit n=1 Tax=Wohlfahrtiimonas chitiniclastica TaxID=400946 RepID=A0A165H207_9GAMM|nr:MULTISPECIES: 3-isopropylmalate dehydratase small subunit [Wohlfahrtiimonas]KZS23871.1 3-isopropylmalate dehydratase small subunit [Wohlfahrtiimonas chitiniclastica]KZX36640.1 3-isopropylmalate dehydratase [Wohlfahrtiimonas chitiniclastica]MBS7814521.1 3-isopropylmalate dehydratase small subunit [Wohlfahrtiimonas chitiniclastica]MBS7816541.1 3-isopropylmalate dehydratase small subunit [Wohlfahrtiimonas chitiniclastica]MBS7818317.1 3-isopropylmalate dehydratase small subunit [Wohlfahrtiimona